MREVQEERKALGKGVSNEKYFGTYKRVCGRAVITGTNRKGFLGEEWYRKSNQVKIKEHKRCGEKMNTNAIRNGW